MKIAELILKARNIYDLDYKKIREEYKCNDEIVRTEKMTSALIAGANLYIERILADYDKHDVDEDLYWAIIYLYMCYDEKEYHLDLHRFEEEIQVIKRLAPKYRPEVMKKN